MKTSLSDRGYGIEKQNNEKIINELKKELLVSPLNNFDSNVIKQYPVYLESDTKIYIPKYYGLQKFGIPKINKLKLGDDCNRLIFKGKLREIQEEVINNYIKAALDPLKKGGIISVPCGFGKTIMAIYIACYFKKKTLFISHKDFLNQQFINTAKLFAPDATIGIIKQKKVDIIDKDIVIASLQSLAIRDYDINIFKQFGLVIFDECHHLAAEVFCRALQKMNIPLTLGLSATLDRKDGLKKVFEWYLGKSVYKFKNKKDIDLIVQIHKYYETSSDYSEVKLIFNGKVNIAGMVNNICNYKPRTLYIINIILTLLKNEPNRKLLVLSERRNHLNEIENLLKFNDLNDIGYYVGGMATKDLDISSTKKIILATYQMSSEGLNIPTLNTVIFASPISDVQQSLGRILREKKEERKYIPLCIDIWDEFSIFLRKGYSRIKYYKNNNYDIEYYINNEKIPEKNDEDKEIKCKFIPDDD